MPEDILSMAIMDTDILTITLHCWFTTKENSIELKGKKIGLDLFHNIL